MEKERNAIYDGRKVKEVWFDHGRIIKVGDRNCISIHIALEWDGFYILAKFSDDSGDRLLAMVGGYVSSIRFVDTANKQEPI